MKIAICGGHLTPAIALIEELENKKDLQILYIGRKFSTEGNQNLSAEYQIITKRQNVKFIKITAGRLQRRFTKHTIPSLLKFPIGLLQSFIYLIKERPSTVISLGSYLSLPVVFSAWLLGIKVIIHEQSSVMGLSNRINSIFAQKIFLAWPIKDVDSEKAQIVGNLFSKKLYTKYSQDKTLASFLKKASNLIFVTGGNQGSHFINNLIFNSPQLLKDRFILHQLGTANYKNDHEEAKKIKNPKYFPLSYIDPQNIGSAFAKADLVVCRSGANTVWDLAILGKAAILIPLPHAASSEQRENARILEKVDMAIILEQKEATPQSLYNQITRLEKSAEEFNERAMRFGKSLPKNAAVKIVDYIMTGK